MKAIIRSLKMTLLLSLLLPAANSCIFGRQELRRAACAGDLHTMGGVTDAVRRQNI
jgi:hypothetical protein